MRPDVWIFLFVLGILFFTWPIMSIFKDNLGFYLFIIWFVFIMLILIASIYSKRDDGGG